MIVVSDSTPLIALSRINKFGIHFKSKGNLKIIRQDLQDRQDTSQHQYPVNPVNPVKIPCFLKWIPNLVY